MKAIFPILILLSAFIILSCSVFNNTDIQKYEEIDESKPVSLLFYNVENLFDTLDNPDKADDDFLPGSSKRWTSARYYDKLQKLSKVILASMDWEMPDFIALSEIENRQCLNDLLRLTPLSSYDYGIVHKESPDFRGIDVALLYNKKRVKLLYYDFYPVSFPFSPGTRTREILYALCEVNGDSLHIFVNHWPSRRGGKEASEPKRIHVAKLLREKADSILEINDASKIVISGDFNDEPADSSIFHYLKAQNDSTFSDKYLLYNYMYKLKKQGQGSYKYRYEWNMLDQIIISKSLYSKKNHAGIFKDDWLLTEDSRYTGQKPLRTYYGPRYQGGISDHLPVFIRFYTKN